MKAKVIRDVCIAGKPCFRGQIVEVDDFTFRILLQNRQVIEAEEIKPTPAPVTPVAAELKPTKKGKK